jgi:hypothetical protein
LVNRASLQNVHPDLRPAVGLGEKIICLVGAISAAERGCANVGRSILIFEEIPSLVCEIELWVGSQGDSLDVFAGKSVPAGLACPCGRMACA